MCRQGFVDFPFHRVPFCEEPTRPIAMTFPKHSKTLHNVWSSVPLKAIRFKIMRNIGHAFFKMHQFPDAIDSYENLLMHGAQHLDFMTGFNLILCYFALGDKATWPAKENRWKRAMIWNWHLCCSVCSIIQWQQADSSRVSPDIVSSVLTDPSIYSEICCSNLEISCSKLRTFGPSAIGWLIGPHFHDIGKQSERIWGQDEKRLLKAAEHRAGGLGGFSTKKKKSSWAKLKSRTWPWRGKSDDFDVHFMADFPD